MNIMDMFRAPATPAAAPAGTPKPDSNIPGAVEGAPDAAAAAEQARQKTVEDANKSPLAEFSKLWETDVLAEGEQASPNWDDPNSIVPSMNIDPAKLVAASKRLDYSKSIDPVKVKAALAGDVGAFTEVLNSVQQAAFANSSMATSRFVEAALKKMAPSIINDALPHHVRKYTVRETVAGDNTIFNDPAVAPLMEALETQFRTKYPRASAKELSDYTKKYLGGFAKALTSTSESGAGRTGKPGQKTGIGNENWEDYFVPSQQQ